MENTERAIDLNDKIRFTAGKIIRFEPWNAKLAGSVGHGAGSMGQSLGDGGN